MKTLGSLIILFILPLFAFSQEEQLQRYSYTQLFQMIEEESDSLFQLKDAIIVLDKQTDQRFENGSSAEPHDIPAYPDSIAINKAISLTNVHLEGLRQASFNNIHFKKEVTLLNTESFHFVHCRFDGDLSISFDDQFEVRSWNTIVNTKLFKKVNIDIGALKAEDDYIQVDIIQNYFGSKSLGNPKEFPDNFSFSLNHNNGVIALTGNYFDTGENPIHISGGLKSITVDNVNLFIVNNEFSKIGTVELGIGICANVIIRNNDFPKYVFVWLDGLKDAYEIYWPDFHNKVINSQSRFSFFIDSLVLTEDVYSPTFPKRLFEQYRIENESVYNQEMKIRGQFIDHYRKLRNTSWANSAYVELKDLETDRLEYQYNQNPGFKTFFKITINEFLKQFSAYGTEPAQAIVISVYVILFFALIYLFFPNSWDKHGRNRIMNRYAFFMKYIDRKAGVHQVYLEDKEADMMEYEEFKAYVESKKDRVPGIFTSTALPLYKWAVSGTRLTSNILRRIDILKGTWEELPKNKKLWKGLLLTGAFAIAIIYDLAIKMLNALMLSINTFTTLGFGEIPIKGLPRYLAIIQGFIGWFMLTIFSVSLISQLLN